MDNKDNNNNTEGHVDVDVKDIPAIASMANFLAGLEFPLDKKEIVDYVESKNTQSDKSQDILDILHKLPDKQYQSMVDITQAIEENKR
jgi:hypothetical protein